MANLDDDGFIGADDVTRPPPTPSGGGLAAAGMPDEAVVAVRALSKELRLLEAGYGLVVAAAMHAADTASATPASATPGSIRGGAAAESPPLDQPLDDISHVTPSNVSLALQLQISQREVELLQDHLTKTSERANALTTALEQREAELHRAHSSIAEHMRQSGALLGSLANLHQNLAPRIAGSPSAPALLSTGPLAATTTSGS